MIVLLLTILIKEKVHRESFEEIFRELLFDLVEIQFSLSLGVESIVGQLD
jgi:hypothetical protein